MPAIWHAVCGAYQTDSRHRSTVSRPSTRSMHPVGLLHLVHARQGNSSFSLGSTGLGARPADSPTPHHQAQVHPTSVRAPEGSPTPVPTHPPPSDMAGQQGWLRGVVKEVLSGDTLVVAGAVKSGIPPEKRLTLASLIAPRLVRRCKGLSC